MKVNVKGLVFVGFAAAILAGAAHAEGENIVTSKAYTDATYEALAHKEATAESLTTNKNSTTNYPSNAAITGYVDSALANNGGTVNSATLTINQNSVSAGTFGANASVDTAINILAPDWDSSTGQQAILNKPSITNAKADITSATSSDTKELPTTYAVQQYVTDKLADSSVVGNGALTVTINGTAASGTYEANQAGSSTLAFTGIEETAHKANAIDTTEGTGNVNSTYYPTTNAVVDYVDAAIAAQSAADSAAYQPVADTGIYVGNNGSWDTLQSGTYTTLTQANGNVTVDVAATTDTSLAVAGETGKLPTAATVKTYVDSAIAAQATTDSGLYQGKSSGLSVGNTGGAWLAADTNVTSTGTSVPTTSAVYNAIQNATGGNTIPEKSSTVCSASTPCALVAEGSLLNWRVMAVSANQNPVAGTCGNAGDSNCDGLPDNNG